MRTAPRSILTVQRQKSQVAGELFKSPEAFALPLFCLCFDRFVMAVEPEDSFLGSQDSAPWLFETLQHEVSQEFNVEPLVNNIHKVMACVELLTSDAFYRNTRSFINICNVLAGDQFDPSTFDPATCSEMAWGLTEAGLLRDFPEEYGEEPFSDEIRAYIGYMLDYEGIHHVPDVLQIGTRVSTGDPLNIWADDPELYSAAFGVQTERSEAIKQLLIDNLVLLLQQLRDLPLRHGSTEDLTTKILQNLQQKEQGNAL